MAEMKIKNLSKIQTDLRRRITQSLRSKDIREGIGEIVVDQIQREKKPVTSKATLAWRKYLEQANKVSKNYSRNSINITFTGELLNDLRKNVKAKFSVGKSSFVIEHSKKKHKKYKKPDGKKTKGLVKTYKQIQGFLEAKGYEYLTFSRTSKKRVIKFVRLKVLSKINKINK